MAGYMPRAARNDWRTPPEIIEVVREALGGGIDLDPCAGDYGYGERMNIRTGQDGLVVPWKGRVFVNPPFDSLAAWTQKACEAGRRISETSVTMLLPSRTDTKYWQRYVSQANVICFWAGRIKFMGAPAYAPFPVAFVHWGAGATHWAMTFGPHGQICFPSLVQPVHYK